jgi:hypothetical protein
VNWSGDAAYMAVGSMATIVSDNLEYLDNDFLGDVVQYRRITRTKITEQDLFDNEEEGTSK